MKKAYNIISVSMFFAVICASIAFSEDDLNKTLRFVSDSPLKITANEVVAQTTSNGRKVFYNGAVKATQGDLTMTCDHLELFWKENNRDTRPSSGANSLGMGDLASLQSIRAYGDVKFVQGERMAVSGEALYDHQKGTITLKKGNQGGPIPRLWFGKNTTVAEIIVVYINENRVEMKNISNSNKVKKGGSKDERTVTIVYPKRQKQETDNH